MGREEKMKDQYEAALMKALAKHVGREKAVGADVLFEAVFAEKANHKINDTRRLRKLITELRREGVPIAAVSSSNGGGYYLPGAGSELAEHIGRLKRRGLSSLALAARLDGRTLAEYLGQIQLVLRGSAAAPDGAMADKSADTMAGEPGSNGGRDARPPE